MGKRSHGVALLSDAAAVTPPLSRRKTTGEDGGGVCARTACDMRTRDEGGEGGSETTMTTTTTTGGAPIERLPPEVVCLILAFLDDDADYGRCRAAARLFRVDSEDAYLERKYRRETPRSVVDSGSVEGAAFMMRRRGVVFTGRALRRAAGLGHGDLARYLEAGGRAVGCACDAVGRAAVRGDLELARHLCDARPEGFTGADVILTARAGHGRLAALLWQRQPGLRGRELILLPAAARSGDTALVTWLCERWTRLLDDAARARPPPSSPMPPPVDCPLGCLVGALREALFRHNPDVVHLLCSESVAGVVAPRRCCCGLGRWSHISAALSAAVSSGDVALFDAVFAALVDADTRGPGGARPCGEDRGRGEEDAMGVEGDGEAPPSGFGPASAVSAAGLAATEAEDRRPLDPSKRPDARVSHDAGDRPSITLLSSSRCAVLDALTVALVEGVRASCGPDMAQHALRVLDEMSGGGHPGTATLPPGIITTAARAGDVAVARLLLPRIRGQPDDGALDAAAEAGHLGMVRLLHEIGCTCTTAAVDQAARNGHARVVRFLLEHRREGCTERALVGAVQWGRAKVLEILHGSGALSRHDIAPPADLVDHAATTGRVDVLSVLIDRIGCLWGADAVEAGASEGHLDVVRFFHDRDPRACTVAAADLAAEAGHLDVVTFLHGKGVHATPAGLDAAAEGGHLDVVRFLVAVGCACTTDAMDAAARRGHLEVVRFLHEHASGGCTRAAVADAAENGHLDVVRFLWSNRDEGVSARALATLGASLASLLSLAALTPHRLRVHVRRRIAAIEFVRCRFDPATGRPVRPAVGPDPVVADTPYGPWWPLALPADLVAGGGAAAVQDMIPCVNSCPVLRRKRSLASR